MKELLVFLAKGFEEIEALTIVDFLRRASIDVTTVSIYNNLEVQGAHGITVLADEKIENINTSEYKGIYIPGGLPGAENLRDNEKVVQLVQEYNKDNKLLSAICAGPVVLDKAGILTENNFTCYPGYEGNLETTGRQNNIVVCKDNVVTAMGPALAMNMAFELIKYFKGESMAESIKKEVLFSKLIENINK